MTEDPTRPPVLALFDGVIGQTGAVADLRAAARHPVHAYLFHGPSGSGKRAAARAFAAALLCPNGGCGVCPTCRRALDATHPDLVLIERSGASISLDDVRKLILAAQRRPFEAERQVLVVNDIHLAQRAAPALLKTVEEPPPSTVFVLLAQDIPPELVTVASRTVKVRFAPVLRSEVVGWLVAQGAAPALAEQVAEGCGGDLDRARLLVSDPRYQERVDLWRSVAARLDGSGASAGALARELLAVTDSALEPLRARHAEELSILAEQAEAWGERGVPGRRDLTDRHHRAERRWRTDELRAGLGVLARVYRDRITDTVVGDTRMGTAAPVVDLRGPVRATALITEASRSLQRNANETLLLESLLVQLQQL